MNRPLVERHRELRQIGRSLEHAANGHVSVVLLNAPSGAGKTALIAEVRDRASMTEITVLDACGSELESGYRFDAVLSLTDSWYATAQPDERDKLLTGHARLAAPLFPGADSTSVAGDGNEFAIIHGLYWRIANLCDLRPPAITLDDVHLCDDLSLGFLNYLATRLDDLPIALFLVVRAGGDVRANAPLMTHLSRLENITTIRPQALTQQAVATLSRWDEPELALSTDTVRRCWIVGGNRFTAGFFSGPASIAVLPIVFTLCGNVFRISSESLR